MRRKVHNRAWQATSRRRGPAGFRNGIAVDEPRPASMDIRFFSDDTQNGRARRAKTLAELDHREVSTRYWRGACRDA